MNNNFNNLQIEVPSRNFLNYQLNEKKFLKNKKNLSSKKNILVDLNKIDIPVLNNKNVDILSTFDIKDEDNNFTTENNEDIYSSIITFNGKNDDTKNKNYIKKTKDKINSDTDKIKENINYFETNKNSLIKINEIEKKKILPNEKEEVEILKNIILSNREVNNNANKLKTKIDFNFSVFDILNNNNAKNDLKKMTFINNENIVQDYLKNVQPKFLSSNNMNLVEISENLNRDVELKDSPKFNNKNNSKLNSSRNYHSKKLLSNKKIEKNEKSNIDKNTEKSKLSARRIINNEDKTLIEEIYKDMKRSNSEYKFILQSTNLKKVDIGNFELEKILTKRNNNSTLDFPGITKEGISLETHLDVIARILFVFAKMNKNIRYVQGMNELATIIYFVIIQEEELKKLHFKRNDDKNRKNSDNNPNINKKNVNDKNSNFNLDQDFISNLNKVDAIKNKDNKINKTKNIKEKEDNSMSKSIKECDLGRLEDIEEEKNFFNLNADRKYESSQNKNQNNNLRNNIYSNNTTINVKKENKVLSKLEEKNVYDLLNMKFIDSINYDKTLLDIQNNINMKDKNREKELTNKNNKEIQNPIDNINKNLLTPRKIKKDKEANLENSMIISEIFTKTNLENINKLKKNKEENFNKSNLKNSSNKENIDINTFVETDYEADTFWCFCYLMDQLKYVYLKSEDHKERGIMKKIENLKNLLKLIDKNLFNYFQSIYVDITIFGFKWFILLFSQNFQLSNVIKIWDHLLFLESQTDIFYKIYIFSLAVFECKKNKILVRDFSDTILELQNLHDINIENLINIFKKIQKENNKKIKKALDLKY